MVMFGFQLPVVAALGTSAAYLVAILLLLHRRGLSSMLYGVFGFYLFLSIVWSAARALLVWRGLIPLVPQIGWEIAYSLIVIMPVVLVVLTILFFERPRAQWVAGMGGVLALLMALVDNNAFDVRTALLQNLENSSPEQLLHTLRWSIWGSFSASAIGLTAWEYIRTWRPLHRNRILYWLIALLLIIAGEGLTLMTDKAYHQSGLVTRLAGALVMTFAIVSYYLPNLRTMVRKSLASTLVTLVTGGLYLLVLWLVMPILLILDPTILLIALGGIALSLAVVSPNLRRWAQAILDKIILGGRYDPSRALREYSAAISNILDLNMLVTIAIGIISEAMETKRGAFLLLSEREDQSAKVSIVPGMGEVKVRQAEFSASSPILNHLRASDQPLTHYEIDMLPQFRVAPLEERVWLQALEMELYVPIRQQNSVVAVIALGERAGGAPYSRADMNVLSTLADQTTVALQNARLVADLKTLNEQMVRLNEELRQANRRLEKLDAAKSDFIQIASHELRTPLTQVRGYADMMADLMQAGVSATVQYLQISQGISRATQRLEDIIRAMLDVSQIDVESLNLTCAPLAMTTVVRMALDSYRDALTQRQLTLTLEGIEGLPPVLGDLQRLCQAFGNIVNNSIKYTPDGGKITITGRAFQVMDNEGNKSPQIEIVIADTGIGIDAQDHELIFEKFYRVGSLSLHSTGATKFMGAGPGLGLPIAKGVIEAHGGRIWVESEGRDEQRCPGSQFHIILPAANPEKIAAMMEAARSTDGVIAAA